MLMKSKFAFLALTVLLVGGPTIASTEARADPILTQPSTAVGGWASRYNRVRSDAKPSPSRASEASGYYGCGPRWTLGADGKCYPVLE